VQSRVDTAAVPHGTRDRTYFGSVQPHGEACLASDMIHVAQMWCALLRCLSVLMTERFAQLGWSSGTLKAVPQCCGLHCAWQETQHAQASMPALSTAARCGGGADDVGRGGDMEPASGGVTVPLVRMWCPFKPHVRLCLVCVRECAEYDGMARPPFADAQQGWFCLAVP
jgi:hypothetical protein